MDTDTQTIEVFADQQLTVVLHGHMLVQIGEVTYSIAPTRDRFTPAMTITGQRVGSYSACMGLVLTPVARNSVEIVGVK